VKSNLNEVLGRRGNHVEREPNPRERAPVDETAATELRLFADNESTLYRQKLAIVENLKKKKRAGRYDAALAPKLWLYWVDAAAKQYSKEFSDGRDWATMFNKPTREFVAAEIAIDEKKRIDAGKYEPLSPSAQRAQDDRVRDVFGERERRGNPVRDPTMAQAVAAYRAGNDAGAGYAPYRDEPGEDTVNNAVEAAERDGWELVLSRRTSDDVALLRNADGEWMAIGGDGMGRNAWAVDVSTALGSERRGNPAGEPFDHVTAWTEQAKPAFDALPGNVRNTVFDVGELAGDLSQNEDLDMPWPTTGHPLRKNMSEWPTAILAHAARVVYFYGHWAPRGSAGQEAQKNGAYWKFSNYADQILSARVGLKRNRRASGAGFVSLVVLEGNLRAQISTPWSWRNFDIGPASSDLAMKARTIIEKHPAPKERATWEREEDAVLRDLKKIREPYFGSDEE